MGHWRSPTTSIRSRTCSFLITHNMPDVFNLSDRLAVLKNGKLVGIYRTADVTEDEVLGMIIAGKRPEGTAEVRRASSSKSAFS